MACAGYLLLENSRPVFVEVSTGALCCRGVKSTAARMSMETTDSSTDSQSISESTPAGDSTAEDPVLPLLEPQLMSMREVSDSSKVKMAGPADEEEPEAESSLGQRDDDSNKPFERVVQLSGFIIEVVEHDLDVPSLPCSFQVVTYKLMSDPDGSTSSEFSDALVLTAKDEATKKLWIKHIKHWNRYGWRDTELIAAEPSDLQVLEEIALSGKLSLGLRSSVCSSQRRLSIDFRLSELSIQRRSSIDFRLSESSIQRRSSIDVRLSGSSSQRQHRRRFYRSTGHLSLVAPP